MMAFVRGLIEKSGGRRFLLSVLCMFMCFVLVWYNKITDIVFRDVVLGTVAVYIAGNTFQKHSNNKKDTDDGE